MNDEKLKILDEFNQEKEVTILNELEINGNNYIIYSIPANEEEEGIYASKLIKDNFGNEAAVSIEDETEKNLVFEAVRTFIDELD